MIRRGYRLVGIGITVAASIYVLLILYENLGKTLEQIHFGIPLIISISLSIIIYSFSIPVTGLAWYLLLRGVGENVRLGEITTILGLSQLAKYIPGNISHHIGRFAMALSRGYAGSSVAVTMILETGWVILSALTLSLITLYLSDQSTLVYQSNFSVLYIWVLVLLILIIPILGNYVIYHLPDAIRNWLFPGNNTTIPGLRTLLPCFFLYTINFLLVGAVLVILNAESTGAAQGNWLLMSGIFGLAWVIGFVVPGAPAGIGIRETVLLEAFGPLYGDDVAVLLTLLLRAVTIIGDCVIFVLALLLSRSTNSAGG